MSLKSPLNNPPNLEDSKIMETSLLTLKRLVERATALGLSWDTAVQLLLIQGLIEVNSHLEALNKALADRGDPEDRTDAGSGRGDVGIRETPEESVEPRPKARGRSKAPNNKGVD
jgi:hypothetical protein